MQFNAGNIDDEEKRIIAEEGKRHAKSTESRKLGGTGSATSTRGGRATFLSRTNAPQQREA